MKKHRLFITLAIILIAAITVLWSVSVGRADPSKQPGQPEMPELPPPVPPDIGQPKPWPTTPPLARELTEEEALEKALAFDSLGVEWVEPWSLATLDKEPDRITVGLYNSRAEAEKSIGYDVEYSPDLEADAGRVWVVTIRGTANASNMMMHMAADTLVDEVTYFISARTGDILGMHTGPPLKQ
jgi:hypothetical protein